MQEIIVGILGAFLGFVILYFVIKWAVSAGIKEAYNDLNVYLRLLITAGIQEAREEKDSQKEKSEGTRQD